MKNLSIVPFSNLSFANIFSFQILIFEFNFKFDMAWFSISSVAFTRMTVAYLETEALVIVNVISAVVSRV